MFFGPCSRSYPTLGDLSTTQTDATSLQPPLRDMVVNGVTASASQLHHKCCGKADRSSDHDCARPVLVIIKVIIPEEMDGAGETNQSDE